MGDPQVLVKIGPGPSRLMALAVRVGLPGFERGEPIQLGQDGCDQAPSSGPRFIPGETMARILVIDDEEPVRSIIRLALEKQGHEVEEAQDGVEGTRLFEASPFDLVITDLIMPEKEGIETILDLRESRFNVPILVISGGLSFGGRSLDKSGPLQDAEALGADASLSKPFRMRTLVELVEDLLSRA